MTSIYEENDPNSLALVEGLGQDNSEEELDFSYLFLYNPSEDDFRGNEDLQLPNHSDQYELCLEQQPKQHHRAHYETEGSRGAVKAPGGGHTVVQLHGYRGKAPLGLLVFIGTADKRLLKPHAFYHEHRIAGKTVTTPSNEIMVNGTKVLEIPLEPKNNMRAV